ncbi:MAG: primosomal protein N' [Desulfovibrionaceae bacterium]|nr:primosomal protein N' [Desulfovibrionaceae bacterium]
MNCAKKQKKNPKFLRLGADFGFFYSTDMFLTIALLSAPYTDLTYRALDVFPASFWKKGLRCCVPLGRGETLRSGILLSVSNRTTLPNSVTIKPLIWPLESTPLLTDEIVELMIEMGRRFGETVGRMAAGFLPFGLRQTSLLLHVLHENKSLCLTLTEVAHASEEMKRLWASEMLANKSKLLPSRRNTDTEECYALNCDPPWPVRPNAKVQIQILEYLFDHGPKNKKQIRTAIGSNSTQALRTLLESDCVTLSREEDTSLADNAPLLPPAARPFALNAEQSDAVLRLTEALSQGQTATYLLYGVTGSGKTAVYLDIARACLKEEKSVFLLVPEVALALKILKDTQTLYPDLPVLLYHGYQPPRHREEIWRRMQNGQPVFVIGTRSALFLPAQHLGCIILDEEHDGSFKQDDGLSYHAKEIAWFRAQHNGALLILGSATPDIRTYYAAKEKHIAMASLRKRVSGNALPPIELVDMNEPGSISESVSLMSKKSLLALEETITRGEQAVVILNRRGFAPHIYCLSCGKTERCPDCDIGLTYHKARGKLICHFCGFSRDFPSPCSSCGGSTFVPVGEGTERIAEELSSYLGQNVLRLDRDSTRRPGQMEAILQAFAREEAQVLVGTQMISKGHHFPKVTLVIAANADMGLSMPDYRASERTFQLLLQSAGRAGRGEKAGRVLLQTRDREHYCWPFVLSYNYEDFYEAEIRRRKKLRYPPFTNLALIRMSFQREEKDAMAELSELARAFRTEAKNRGLVLLGPAPSPHALLCGRNAISVCLKRQTGATSVPSSRMAYTA